MMCSACVKVPGHEEIEPQTDDTFPYAFEYTYDDKKNKYRLIFNEKNCRFINYMRESSYCML
jgi:hypothetical protein